MTARAELEPQAVICPGCDGAGVVIRPPDEDDHVEQPVRCTACNGEGVVKKRTKRCTK